MHSANDYEKEMWRIVETIAPNRKLETNWESVHEAKLCKSEIVQVQKQLRLLKKNIGSLIRDINASYANEKVKIGTGFGAGLAAGIFGKKLVGKSNALAKQNLRNNQLNAIAPYQNVSFMIDQVMEQLDRVKLQVDQWILEQQ